MLVICCTGVIMMARNMVDNGMPEQRVYNEAKTVLMFMLVLFFMKVMAFPMDKGRANSWVLQKVAES